MKASSLDFFPKGQLSGAQDVDNAQKFKLEEFGLFVQASFEASTSVVQANAKLTSRYW